MDNFQKPKRTDDPTLVKLLEADSDLATQAAALANQMEALQEKRRSLQSVIELFGSTNFAAEAEPKTRASLEDDKWYEGQKGQYNFPQEAAAADASSHGSTGQSLLDLFTELTADMTEEEIAQLPRDGAEQHDYYIYGTPKRLL